MVAYFFNEDKRFLSTCVSEKGLGKETENSLKEGPLLMQCSDRRSQGESD
jgi:hypothetical protein